VKGERPPFPNNHRCPDAIKELIIACWAPLPNERPTNEKILNVLLEWNVETIVSPAGIGYEEAVLGVAR